MIDLGAWLSGQHAIPGESVGTPEKPVTELAPPNGENQ
jgi:endogenous inhibitor of DNA gyrase (YacG/DUF329 family)